MTLKEILTSALSEEWLKSSSALKEMVITSYYVGRLDFNRADRSCHPSRL
jgi:hypothetical protein